MLPLQFFGQNIHFALSLFFSLATFATFWLYFDAYRERKSFKELAKWVGFLLIAVSFLINATIIEQSFLGKSLFSSFSEISGWIIRIIGYLAIIYSLIVDPLQSVPKTEGIKPSKNYLAFFSLSNIKFALPLGSLIIALLYYRRSTKGLERHLRPIAFAFFFLSLADSLSLATLLRSSNNVNVANFSAAFGPLWILEQICLLVATVVLGKWVWGYLVKRLQSQLFIILTTSVLLIFLIVSVSFTYLLGNNIQTSALNSLETAGKVLNYSLNSKKSEVASIAEVFSQNKEIIAEVVKDKTTFSHDKLNSLVGNSLENKKVSSIIITDQKGTILLRAEEPEKWGEAISSDPVVKKTLEGEDSSGLTTGEGVLVPVVYLQAAKPLLRDSKVVGSVLVSLAVSNSFLDNIKSSTGLDSAIYSGNSRSATTLVSTNGKDRSTGVKEENSEVKSKVLSDGYNFKGSLAILNRPFLAVYQPLKNVNNEIIGMSFTGQSQVLILKDSGKSVEFIFLLSTLLLVIAILPSLWISKYIARQLH